MIVPSILELANQNFSYTYPGAWINLFVAAGLVYLHFQKSEQWTSPWHTYLPVILLFLASNVFLAMIPFVPPTGSWNTNGYPYYVFPAVGMGVLVLGGIYWAVWTRVLPAIGGYQVVAKKTASNDGAEELRYVKISGKNRQRATER